MLKRLAQPRARFDALDALLAPQDCECPHCEALAKVGDCVEHISDRGGLLVLFLRCRVCWRAWRRVDCT